MSSSNPGEQQPAAAPPAFPRGAATRPKHQIDLGDDLAPSPSGMAEQIRHGSGSHGPGGSTSGEFRQPGHGAGSSATLHRPRRYSVWQATLGPMRLRIAIPVLLFLLPLLFGAATYSLVELQIDRADSDLVKAELESMRGMTLLLVVAACVIALLIGFVLVYYVVKPLDRLRGAVESIAQGDFSTRLDLGRAHDEVGKMGRSFDDMIATLNDLFSTRNRLMFDNSIQAIVTVSLEGRILSANDGAVSLFGVDSSEKLVGANLLDELNRQPGNEPLGNMLYDALLYRREVSARRHVLTNTRREATPVVISTTLLRDEAGKPEGVAVTLQNVAGLRDFYERINRTDRLAAIGTLAMGLAHEIRNPLGSIKGLVQILVADADKESDTQRYGGVIIEEVNRLDRLISELLEFSQPSGYALEEVDLGQLLERVEQTARAKAESERPGISLKPATIELSGLCRSELPRDRVHQALLNIVQNAFEAAGEDGEVFLSVRPAASPGAILCEIANTGSSIPADMLDKVFEPFFTTKEKGTGLGLAISYQILTYLGADLEVSSTEDRVAFQIRIPVTASGERQAVPPDAVPPPAGSSSAEVAAPAGERRTA